MIETKQNKKKTSESNDLYHQLELLGSMLSSECKNDGGLHI